jgi:tetratricopeptide (TPR) repeat protein
MLDRRRQRITVLMLLVAVLNTTSRAADSDVSSERRLTRIQQLIGSGDLNSATSTLEAALRESPKDPRLLNFRGVIQAQLGHFAAAESSFREAIQATPRLFEAACLNLGKLYQQHPDEPRAGDKALAVYLEMLKRDPGHVEANYQAARLLNTRGSYAASLQHLSHLPLEAQGQAPALGLRCANNFALDRAEQGEAAALQLLTSSDLSERDVLPLLPVLATVQREELALRLLSALADKGLASPDTLEKLAALYEKRGNVVKARAVLERTPLLAHPSVALLSHLAQLAYRAGDLEGALGYLARARDLEPGNAAVHFFFGIVCVDLKLPPEAKASLQEALRLQPDDPYFNYAFGAVLVNEKNAEQAIVYFEKYRVARPDDPRGAFALGVAYFEAYQIDAARKTLLLVVDNPATRMGAQLYLGRLALIEEHAEEALVHFQEAVKANANVPEPYAEMALVRIRRKEYDLAAKSLAAALALTPDHYVSNLRLLMLYQKTKDARAVEQSRHVEQLRRAGEEKERLLLRTLDIRPY